MKKKVQFRENGAEMEKEAEERRKVKDGQEPGQQKERKMFP